MTTFQTIATPDGAFSILSDDDDRVLASGWTDSLQELIVRLRPDARPQEVRDGHTDAASAVEDYYAGDIAAIDVVAVRQNGTAMQAAGWEHLRRITPGAPLTYAQFAATLGAPTAVRAAAAVCARNAPALFVPCHRVLRTGGALGGFAWGLDVKRALLDREAARVA
ncbi:methylated-DNA--[protein]-cysteine S-methyltransferase [Microbacterium koreense]|uniref:Methylated-DNA--[protein]-cysteine S-methyltransferase n=1 Tax=Microbacterium koreense TaxID=323761 RepID=A0ABW2ZV81_9MICO